MKLPWQRSQRLVKAWRKSYGEEAGFKHCQRLAPLFGSIQFQPVRLIKKIWDDENFNLSTDTKKINESFLLHIEVPEVS